MTKNQINQDLLKVAIAKEWNSTPFIGSIHHDIIKIKHLGTNLGVVDTVTFQADTNSFYFCLLTKTGKVKRNSIRFSHSDNYAEAF